MKTLATRQLTILLSILDFTHLNDQNKVKEFNLKLNSLLKLDEIEGDNSSVKKKKEDEIRMIMLYTNPRPSTPFSKLLNDELRKENREELKPYFPLLRLLLLSLNKLPRYEGVIWRLIKLKKEESPNFLKYDYRQGNKFFWWGFTSCTTNIAQMRNSHSTEDSNYVEILFCIHSQRGIEIDLYSCQPHQEDILLLPGTYLEVINYTEYNLGFYLITLKELIPEDQQKMFPELEEKKTEKQMINDQLEDFQNEKKKKKDRGFEKKKNKKKRL